MHASAGQVPHDNGNRRDEAQLRRTRASLINECLRAEAWDGGLCANTVDWRTFDFCLQHSLESGLKLQLRRRTRGLFDHVCNAAHELDLGGLRQA